jgi:hypothetical protein
MSSWEQKIKEAAEEAYDDGVSEHEVSRAAARIAREAMVARTNETMRALMEIARGEKS